MKLHLDQRILEKYDRGSLTQIMRDIQQSVNSIAEGKQVGFYLADTAAPTTGIHAIGDFVLNSAPAELGSASSKYIIHGWRCTVSGEPGTWLQCRFLTGN
jgi:hypothetical protein